MKTASILSAFLFALIFLASSQSASSAQSITGRIIHTDPGSLVIKAGYKETEFIYETDVEIILSQQAKDFKDSRKIEICQYVRINYVIEEKVKKAVKVEIIKPSDCYN